MKAEGARDEGAESSDKEDVLTDRGHGAEGGEHMRAHRGLAAVAGPDAGAGAVRRCSPGARRGGGLRHRPRRHVGGSARACGPRPAGDKEDVIGRVQIDRGTKRASVAGESPGLGLSSARGSVCGGGVVCGRPGGTPGALSHCPLLSRRDRSLLVCPRCSICWLRSHSPARPESTSQT